MIKIIKIRVINDILDPSGSSMMNMEYFAAACRNGCYAEIGQDWLWSFVNGQYLVLEELGSKENGTKDSSGLVQSLGVKPNKITIDF